MVYHQVLRQGFFRLHNLRVDKPLAAMPSADDNAVIPASEYIQSLVSVDLYRKSLRVKSSKTLQWLADASSASTLLVSTLAVSPLERIMWHFMQWQQEEAYLKEADGPITQLANPDRSPVCDGMRTLCLRMTTGRVFPDTPGSPSIQELAAGPTI